MTDQPKHQLIKSEKDGKPVDDLTGRDQLVSNVLFSWGAYFVFIIAGFIMPRMIDRRLGQELLGVWDFAWSIVSYFGLVQLGISSSVNRYVAKYRAANDISGVNRIVSSASCVLGGAGLLVLGLTIAVSLLLPELFGARLGENVNEAQWVVFFLGASLGIQMAFAVFGGVLTGCHRWEIHNINISGWYAVTVAGMIVSLLLGGRLWTLAAINLAGEIMTDVRRLMLAHRVCEGLRLRPSLVQWLTIKELFIFGGKTLIPSVSNLLLNQTTSILILAYLGPASLALFSRPRSLMHHVDTLVRKMAMTLIPTTSSLESTGNQGAIQQLVIKSTRYSLYLTLPIVLVLTVFGDAVMQFWMGPRYANGLVTAILAAGFLIPLAQTPVLMILVGLNAHGKAGMAQFVASLCSVGLTALVLGPLKWGLAGTAVAVTLPMTIINLVYLPLLICQRVVLDMRQYFLSVTARSAVHVLPFAICLVVARVVSTTEPLTGLLWGGTIGSLVLATLYWRYVLPDRIKVWVCWYLRKVLRLTGLISAKIPIT